MDMGRVEEERETVARRVEFIEVLDDDGPLQPRDFVDKLDHSRSTVTRALRELRDTELVEKRNDGYVATVAGVMAAKEHRRHEETSRAILTSEELLSSISDAESLPPELLAGGNTELAEKSAPFRPVEKVSERIREAERVQVYLPTLVNPIPLRVLHQNLVSNGVSSVGIFDDDLLAQLKGQYPQILAEMGASDAFSPYTGDGPPYGMFLTTAEETTTVSVVVYDGDTGIAGIIVNDSESAVKWVENEFERLRDSATSASDDLDSVAEAVEYGVPKINQSDSTNRGSSELKRDGGTAGHALPLELESEGFVRLSREFFNSHEQAPPEVSWQTGFTLAEVRAGHTVDRFDDDGRDFVNQLLEDLQEGDDHVVLGPPGAGKSTVCMTAACEWHDQQIGPVLYRERGTGDEFSSPSLLEAYLRQTDDHALVVVEDGIRNEANDVFETMQVLGGRDDVTFLLDSRTNEWNGTDEFSVNPRLDAHRQASVKQVFVPELDEKGCERFVEQFQLLLGDEMDISAADLKSLVRNTAEATESNAPEPGTALLAQTYLSRRIDPLGEQDTTWPNTLETDVRETYQSLSDADSDIATDLGVLVNLLNAAGIPVAEEYLYALASPEEYGELEIAISVLKGKVLFNQRNSRGRSTVYRTYHETWSRRFLDQLLEILPEEQARDLFGSCVSSLLALADDADSRKKIERQLHRVASHLHRIESDPEGWADEIAERVFTLGQSYPALAPLYGETGDGTIELPDACSEFFRQKQQYWRADMNGYHGEIKRSKCEIQQLVNLDASMRDLTELEAAKLRFFGYRGLTTYHRLEGEFDRAVECGQQLLELAEEIDDKQKIAWARFELIRIEKARLNIEVAREQISKLEKLARRDNLSEYITKAIILDGSCLSYQADHKQSKQCLKEALHRVEGENNERLMCDVLLELGFISYSKNDFRSAEDYFSTALDSVQPQGYTMAMCIAKVGLGAVARKKGRVNDAESFFEQSAKQTSGIGQIVSTHHGEWAKLAFDRGNLKQAADLARSTLDGALNVQSAFIRVDSFCILAQIAIRREEFEEAITYIEQGREIAESLNNPLKIASCDRVRAQLELARENHEKAKTYAQKGREQFCESDITDEEADCYRILGLIALEQDNLETATEYLTTGLEKAEESGFVRTIGELHEAVGQLESARGNESDARSHFEQAANSFAQLGDEKRRLSVE